MPASINRIINLFLLLSIFSVQTPGQGFYKDLFVDAGVGLTKRPEPSAAVSLNYSMEYVSTESSSLQNSVMVSNQYDANGALLYPDGAPRFKLYYCNGGASVTHGQSLGDYGVQRIRTFYRNGGSYTGSCAGSAIFSLANAIGPVFSYYYQIWSGYVVRVTVGPLDVNLIMLENSALKQFGFFQSPALIANVYFNYGNYMAETVSYPPETIPLMRYSIPGQQMDGHVASFSYKQSNQTGRGVVIGCHPERYDSGDRQELMKSIYRYALDGIAPPQVKGELLNGVTRAMNKSTEENIPQYTKIGDKQYHHFLISLKEPVSNFRLSLQGEAGYDLALCMKKGSFAFEQSAEYSNRESGATKSLTISSLSAGEWYVAVECRTVVTAVRAAESYQYTGNLGVLNGVAYSVTASWNTTATTASHPAMPQEFSLSQNYPNPFNPTTHIRFSLPSEQHVLITVTNVLGKEVATLLDDWMSPGTHSVTWSGRTTEGIPVPAGVYLYYLRSGQFSDVKKMILLK